MEKETYLVLESDGDSPIVSSLSICYNLYDELVICLETENYCKSNSRQGDNKICAVLSHDSMNVLSRRLKIRPEKLSEHLYDRFNEGGYISRASYIRHRFKDMLEYILDLGGKYRLFE